MMRSPGLSKELSYLATVALTGSLLACVPRAPDRPGIISPSPILTSTPVEARLIPTPTYRLITAPVTPITRGEDLDLKHQIEQSRAGESLILDNPTVGNIIRLPWEGGQAYIARLTGFIDGKNQTLAYVHSSDCLFNALQAGNKLGESKGYLLLARVWSPNQQVQSLKATNSYPIAPTILRATEVTENWVITNCDQVTAAERLEALIKQIHSEVDWEKGLEDIANGIGRISRRILEGLRSGFATTPTPVRLR